MDLSHIPDVDVNKQRPVSAGRKLGELLGWWLSRALWALPFGLWREMGIGAGLGALLALIVACVLWAAIRQARLTKA